MNKTVKPEYRKLYELVIRQQKNRYLKSLQQRQKSNDSRARHVRPKTGDPDRLPVGNPSGRK